jgi:hypothetical protein
MAGQRAQVAAVVLAVVACLGMAGGASQNPPQQPPPAAPPQQKPAPAPQQPTFRTGINFVRVDVIVTDKSGKPVTDLTQADFEVQEDGKPQAIDTFKLIEITGIPKPGDEAPREIRSEYDEEYETSRDDVRLFVMFLDDYHVRIGSSMSVRQTLANFITSRSARWTSGADPLTPMAA